MKRYVKSSELTFRPDYDTYYNRGGRAGYKVSNGDTVYEPYSFQKGTNRTDLPIDDEEIESRYTEDYEVDSQSGKKYYMTKEYKVRKNPDRYPNGDVMLPDQRTTRIREI